MKIDLGTIWALCDDREQADFLNAAGRALLRCCDGPNKAEIQAMRIVDLLDDSGRALLKRLAEWIRHDEETPRVVKRVVYEDVVEYREPAEPREPF